MYFLGQYGDFGVNFVVGLGISCIPSCTLPLMIIILMSMVYLCKNKISHICRVLPVYRYFLVHAEKPYW